MPQFISDPTELGQVDKVVVARAAVDSPDYWKNRIEKDKLELRLALHRCTSDEWETSNSIHTGNFAKQLKKTDSILDAGCGYGRLLNLMPKNWEGSYCGIDISPDFIDLAKATYPEKKFILGDLRKTADYFPEIFDMSQPTQYRTRKFSVAVCLGLKNMVDYHLGQDYWKEIETNLRAVASKIFVLEYGVGGYWL